MNARERFLLMAAAVLLGAVIFKFAIYDPHQAEYAALVAVRDAARSELLRNQQIVARGAQVRAEYQRVVASLAILEKKLPSEKEIPALLTAMEQLTHQLGVDFNGIHPGPLEAVTQSQTKPASGASPAPAGRSQGPAGKQAANPIPYSAMTVSLSLTGTFAQTLAYLAQLPTFPRLIVVNSIALSPKGQLSQLGVSLSSEIYVLGTPGGTPGGGSPTK